MLLGAGRRILAGNSGVLRPVRWQLLAYIVGFKRNRNLLGATTAYSFGYRKLQ